MRRRCRVLWLQAVGWLLLAGVAAGQEVPATGKTCGVELAFAGAGTKWKLMLRGENNGKYDAENAASVISAGRGPSR